MTDIPDVPGHISRRRFIIGGAAVVGGAAFLNACGDDDDDDAGDTDEGTTGGEAAATTAPAASNLPCSVFTEASMKLACRIVTMGAPMPGGRLMPKPARASSTRCVSFTVSASGCYWIPWVTAGLPL